MKKKVFVISMCLVLIFSLFAACGNGGDDDAAQDPAEKTLYMRLGQSLSSLDWENSTHTYDMYVWHQMFEGLYGMDESGEGYYEELADGITISEDGTVYTIPLREGVTFQNGDPLKASDVVFSYKRAMQNSRFNYLTSPIKDIVADGDNTVIMTLNAPNSAIAHTLFCIKISSEKEITEQGADYGTIPHKAGTGAYYVTEYDIASGVKLAAYDGYWRGAPAIKNVEYKVIADEAAAIIAYENGELDYLSEVPMTDWESVAAAGNGEIIPGNDITWMGVNWASPTCDNALGNEKVRQAIMMCVNKEDINLAIYDGKGKATNVYMATEYVATQPATGFHTWEYDVEKAKALLAEAGYKEGDLSFTLLTYGGADSPKGKAAVVVQSQLQAIGINCEVDIREYAAAEADMYGQNFDLCLFGDSGNYDFNNIRQQVHSESVGMYLVKYKGDNSPVDWERLEELVDLGVSVTETEDRLVYYTELWNIVMESATNLPLLHKPIGVAWATDLETGAPVPSYYKIRTFSWK